MPKPLTDKQSIVYDYILYSLAKEYTLPTLKEIASDLGMSSPNAANDFIKSLVKKGWLEKRSDKSKRANYKPIFIELTITRTEEV